MFAEIDIDWAALGQVIWISAVPGIFIATVLGVCIVASLRSSDVDGGGSVLALRAVTVISVALVAAALVLGIYWIWDK